MENRIRERIKESCLTQRELAEKLDMTTIGLNQIAATPMPKIETFVKIANALGVPAWSLLLTDDEIKEIRATSTSKGKTSVFKTEDETIKPVQCQNCGSRFVFHCPKCGASLKVVPDNNEE